MNVDLQLREESQRIGLREVHSALDSTQRKAFHKQRACEFELVSEGLSSSGGAAAVVEELFDFALGEAALGENRVDEFERGVCVAELLI
jgi:hypothetical protein